MKSLWILILSAMLLPVPVVHAGWLDTIKNTGESIGRGLGKTGDTPSGEAKQTPREKEEKGGSPASEESVFRNFDFIPGETVIFFDDFSDTDVGEFPRKWTLKGPSGGGNPLEVVSLGDKRFLASRTAGKGSYQSAAKAYLRLKGGDDLPEKFTIEFDAVLGGGPSARKNYLVHLLSRDQASPSIGSAGNLLISGTSIKSANTTAEIDMSDGRIHRISIGVNGTFVKAYVDGDRVINDPDALTRPIKWVGLGFESSNGVRQEKFMITNFRLARGGKDIRSALDTDGKIVAHGIHFDPGSDRIRPESTSTLKSILGLLTANPDLKFSIEGHTDNQGGAKVNKPLSEKRAAAVKDWLAGKGIGTDRLTTTGMGDTKPLSPNDSPEGRANNRRVEFIRL
ncbi:MAG: OmpA family protein [Deltaproteobacteria bacterium]|nr:OmpA family protein [Deltaproteobacteria bacterium]